MLASKKLNQNPRLWTGSAMRVAALESLSDSESESDCYSADQKECKLISLIIVANL